MGRPSDDSPYRAQNALQAQYIHYFNRQVPVPPALAPPDTWYCTANEHTASAACVNHAPYQGSATQATYVGTYPPFGFVLEGLAARVGSNPTSALLWARLAGAVAAAGLLAIGFKILVEPGNRLTVVGALVALSPMAVFSTAVVSSSTLEVASAFLATASVMRLWREPDSSAGLFGLGLGGSVLALVRQFGPAWILLLLLLLVVLLRQAGLRAVWAASRGHVLASGAAILAATILNIGWSVLVPGPPRDIAQVNSFLLPAIASLPETFGESIGVFGHADILMPRAAYAAYGLIWVSLVSTALLVGRKHMVRILELDLVVVVGLVVFLTAAAIMPLGFTAQGRHMMPALMTVPFLAGEIVSRNRDRLRSWWSTACRAGVVALAGLQFLGWYAAAHRYAVGLDGPWRFLDSPQWQPAIGWLPVLVLAVAGSCLVGSSALTALRGRL